MENVLRQLWRDILSGAGLLTRLPLPDHQPRGIAAAWAWPLVGLVLGLIAVLTGAIAVELGLAPWSAAVVVLLVQVMCTGGLHEDGLADTADGLWGGWTRERRLEIMRDSRIGSYGVIALVLALLARWSLLAAVLASGSWGAVLAAAVLSRGVLPGVMGLVPNARDDGLSRGVGRPAHATALQAAALALLLAVFCIGWGVIAAAIVVLLVALVLAHLAQRRIGGQTGDILGAIQVLSEIAVLMTLT